MIVSIHQPAYLPWLGYFSRIKKSDIHIILDDVQFEKNSYINRNKIWSNNDWIWLTVPVLTKGKHKNLEIRNVEINNKLRWRRKHWESIFQSYNKSKYFENHKTFFYKIYSCEWHYIKDLCSDINKYLLNALNIKTKMYRSSELNVKGTKGDLILNLCKSVCATSYLSGPFGKNYLNESKFSEYGIELKYDESRFFRSRCDLFGNKINDMSTIDYLFVNGEKTTEKYI